LARRVPSAAKLKQGQAASPASEGLSALLQKYLGSAAGVRDPQMRTELPVKSAPVIANDALPRGPSCEEEGVPQAAMSAITTAGASGSVWAKATTFFIVPPWQDGSVTCVSCVTHEMFPDAVLSASTTKTRRRAVAAAG
jgi:hypothetical protein